MEAKAYAVASKPYNIGAKAYAVAPKAYNMKAKAYAIAPKAAGFSALLYNDEALLCLSATLLVAGELVFY